MASVHSPSTDDLRSSGLGDKAARLAAMLGSLLGWALLCVEWAIPGSWPAGLALHAMATACATWAFWIAEGDRPLSALGLGLFASVLLPVALLAMVFCPSLWRDARADFN